MQLISPIVPRPTASSSQGLAASGPANSAFQMLPSAQTFPSSVQGLSATASPTLGNQTLSALLQTQEFSQTRGHGGAAHHGAKNWIQDMAREEVMSGEEAQITSAPKKLTNMPKIFDASQANRGDEEGGPMDDPGEGKEDQREKNGKKDG